MRTTSVYLPPPTPTAFNTDLRAAYALAESNRVKADVARGNRDVLITPIRPRFQEYKAAVIAKLGATSALAKTIPIVSSKPGSTPNAVQLNGAWNDVTKQAHFVITKSDALNFSEYAYRYSAGTKYDADTASKLASITDINKLILDSQMGLEASGLSIAVKCFVVVDTGNEKGSNTVVITRP